MEEKFVEMLNEPKNTLGRTEEVVQLVLDDNSRIEELYKCYFQSDEWVRLRTSSSFKRIWRKAPELVLPYIEGLVDDVSSIEQPSVNWTFAQFCLEMEDYLNEEQKKNSIKTLKRYLKNSDDWIVQNSTIETLGTWSLENKKLSKWLIPKLESFVFSDKKSVAKRAKKWLISLK